MSRPLALITGASSGIGAALAQTLAKAGHDIVLVARRRDRLEQLRETLAESGASSEILTVDLSDQSGLAAAVARAEAGDVDVLVSNAGVSGYGSFASIPVDDIDRAWRLNATATPLTVCLPGLAETTALDELSGAERRVLMGNAGPELAPRYR